MDPWFASQHAALASFAALVSLLCLLEPYALRGKRRLAVMVTCGAVFLTGTALLAVAAYARLIHQPPYVYIALCIAGGIVALSSALGFGRFLHLYRAHERTSAAAPPQSRSGAAC